MTNEQFLTYIMRSLILEYRLSIDTVSEIFGGDPNDLYGKIINMNDSYFKNALIYVLDYETKEAGIVDQTVAKRKAMIFLTKFKMLKTAKERLELINQLNDNSEVNKIRNKNSSEYTEEEYEIISEYRYKYALSRRHISKEFGINEKTIYSRDARLGDGKKEKFKLLSAYNDPANGHIYPSAKKL